jgi:hypothetical protein
MLPAYGFGGPGSGASIAGLAGMAVLAVALPFLAAGSRDLTFHRLRPITDVAPPPPPLPCAETDCVGAQRVLSIDERLADRPWIDVTADAYGARGDGVTLDQAALQQAIDEAGRVGGVVWIPRRPASYLAAELRLHAGIAIVSDGARLKQPDGTGNWKRLLYTDDTTWSSDRDSEPIVITGLVLDGNRRNREPYRAYEKQQSHAMFFKADAAAAGRIRVIVDNVRIVDTTGDGISVYKNADVTVTNVTTENCFRGGLVVTGGHSRLHAEHVVLVGDEHPSGIDVEIDGAGFGGSLATQVYLADAELAGDFDLALNTGGSAVVERVVSRRAPFIVHGGFERGGMIRIRDSRFVVGRANNNNNRIVRPHDVTFENVEFVLERPADDPTDGEYQAILVHWNIQGPVTARGQRLRFVGCRFRTGETVSEHDLTYGILTQATVAEHDNVLEVVDSTFDGFDYGIRLVRGGELIVRDTAFHTTDTAIRWKGVGGSVDNTARLLLDGVTWTSPYYMEIDPSPARNVVDHRDVDLPALRNAFKALDAETADATEFRGSRTIRAAGPPGPDAAGLTGDVWIAGEGPDRSEYRCTSPGMTGATWHQGVDSLP